MRVKNKLGFNWVQKQRMKVRAESLELWKEHSDPTIFDDEIKKSLDKLKFYTKIYHQKRRLPYLKNRLFDKIKESVFFKKILK